MFILVITFGSGSGLFLITFSYIDRFFSKHGSFYAFDIVSVYEDFLSPLQSDRKFCDELNRQLT